MIAGFVRGLSTRDVEASLAEALDPQATLSRSTVSRICEQISTEFAAWSTRSLTGIDLDYLYLDGTCFAPPPRCPRRAGAGRLWHHHHRQPGVPGAGPGG